MWRSRELEMHQTPVHLAVPCSFPPWFRYAVRFTFSRSMGGYWVVVEKRPRNWAEESDTVQPRQKQDELGRDG